MTGRIDINAVRRYFDPPTNQQVTDEEVAAALEWFSGDRYRVVLAARFIARSLPMMEAAPIGGAICGCGCNDEPSETPHCAGRSAAAHERMPVVDGVCPACGERDLAVNGEDAGAPSATRAEAGQAGQSIPTRSEQ